MIKTKSAMLLVFMRKKPQNHFMAGIKGILRIQILAKAVGCENGAAFKWLDEVVVKSKIVTRKLLQ